LSSSCDTDLSVVQAHVGVSMCQCVYSIPMIRYCSGHV
jgi:hypothetical protein